MQAGGTGLGAVELAPQTVELKPVKPQSLWDRLHGWAIRQMWRLVAIVFYVLSVQLAYWMGQNGG